MAPTAMPEYPEEKPAEGLNYPVDNGSWGIYPEGWQDSYYWVFYALDRIARDDAAAAAHIFDTMNSLQDEFCEEEVKGNDAAQKAYQTALELLKEYIQSE